MKFVTISNSYFELCQDPELLRKGNRRPHVLLLSLKYRGSRHSFAVPLRSNIPPASPKSEYFALPPRPTTKPGHRHGLHYIKMFPVTKKYVEKFWIGENQSYILFQKILSKHISQIVQECQAYLDRYAEGHISPYAVNIDAALEKLRDSEG